jgi:hypothetical protein
MAQVGCPDRRIDRLCITWCSPSQLSHHAGIIRRDFVYAASATGFLYRSPLAIMAQAIRASLLASAMAATLVGFRASTQISPANFSFSARAKVAHRGVGKKIRPAEISKPFHGRLKAAV